MLIWSHWDEWWTASDRETRQFLPAPNKNHLTSLTSFLSITPCYHLETPGPVPRLAPRQLAHVAEDGGGLGQGHITVHQHRDLLEWQLGPFPLLSPYEQTLCSPWSWHEASTLPRMTQCSDMLLTWRAWCWPPHGGWRWTSAAAGWSGRGGRCGHQTALWPTLLRCSGRGDLSERRLSWQTQSKNL